MRYEKTASFKPPRRFHIFMRRHLHSSLLTPNSSFEQGFHSQSMDAPPHGLTLNPPTPCQDFLPNFIDIPSSLRYNYSVMVQINGTTRCKEVFIHGKNDIPAEQPLEKTDPRFPCSYENKSRPYCSEEKKSKGQKGIKCLI